MGRLLRSASEGRQGNRDEAGERGAMNIRARDLRQLDLFTSPAKIMPPKPIRPGIWQPTIMDWLAEHPKVEGPSNVAELG
jgi:hypothetical protein